MIHSTPFLSRMMKQLRPELLKAPHSQKIARWCMDYFIRYEQAPKEAITDLWLAHKGSMLEGEEDTTGVFLRTVQDTYQAPSSTEFAISEAMRYINECNIEKFYERLEMPVRNKDVAEVDRIVRTYAQVEHMNSQAVDVFDCSDIVETAFNKEDEVLFEFPEALGKLLGPVVAGDFITGMAPAKTGKTWFLIASALEAVMAGKRVYMASLEMGVPEMLTRIYSGLLATPTRAGDFTIPYFYKDSDADESYKIGTNQEYIKPTAITKDRIDRFNKTFKEYFPHGGFRLESFPTKATTLSDIRRSIDNIRYYEGFEPDVIIIDYLDILKPESKGSQEYAVIDNEWARARGWALEEAVAIITVSQGNRGSYAATVLDASDIAGSIGKAMHVTKMVGIQNTPVERQMGLTRYKLMFTRDGVPYSDQVVTTGCLGLGRPIISSRWMSELDYSSIKGVEE